MPRTTYAERLAVIETDLKAFKQSQKEHNDHVKENLDELKELLKDHIEWESKKYEGLKKIFASKRVEYIVYGMVGIILTSFGVAIVRMVIIGG